MQVHSDAVGLLPEWIQKHSSPTASSNPRDTNVINVNSISEPQCKNNRLPPRSVTFTYQSCFIL